MKHLHDMVVTWPARDGECNVSCIIWFIECNIMRALSGDIDTVLTPHVTHVKYSYWHWQWGVARPHTPPRILFLNYQQLHVPVKIIRKWWCLYDVAERRVAGGPVWWWGQILSSLGRSLCSDGQMLGPEITPGLQSDYTWPFTVIILLWIWSDLLTYG